MSHQAYDHVPQRFAHTDQDPGKQAQDGATKAFQDQFHTALAGSNGSFLDQMDKAMGGSGVAERPKELPGKEAQEHLNKKQEGIHNEAVAFGLANDKGGHVDTRSEQAKLNQTFRDMAFASVYDSAVNNPKNQSGFPGSENKVARLDFEKSPQLNPHGTNLNTQGTQLRWAS